MRNLKGLYSSKSSIESIQELGDSMDFDDSGTKKITPKRKSLSSLPIEIRTITNYVSKSLFIDPEENFLSKFERYVENHQGSKCGIIFLDSDEQLRRNTSKYYDKEKRGKYSKYFEEFIRANWKKEKFGVSLEFTSGFREIIKDENIKNKVEDRVYQKVPTFTHQAIALLIKKGLYKTVITSETSNQLRIAGVPEESIIEVNGNAFCESNLVLF